MHFIKDVMTCIHMMPDPLGIVNQNSQHSAGFVKHDYRKDFRCEEVGRTIDWQRQRLRCVDLIVGKKTIFRTQDPQRHPII